MKSFYSILKYVNNSFSNESIALGLLAVNNGEIHFQVSKQKTGLVKKLNSKNYKLLEFSLKQFTDFIEREISNEPEFLIKSEKKINLNFINKLSKYNNGILQFSKPETINSEISADTFLEYYHSIIGEELRLIEKNPKSSFKYLIEDKLYKPLENKIDVDFTLKMKQLDSLFFDFHFDGIGVNGKVYGAKALDLNANRRISSIKNEISNFESVIKRLNEFAFLKGLSQDNCYFLIVDPYQGNDLSYNDLYSLLQKTTMPFFEILSLAEAHKFVNLVLDNKARKFSEELSLPN